MIFKGKGEPRTIFQMLLNRQVKIADIINLELKKNKK